jgi:hypothetical protein
MYCAVGWMSRMLRLAKGFAGVLGRTAALCGRRDRG